ncbi:hypothetical protein MKZ38_005363 [Zalerion maritima]|uniref:Thioesterase domain-containing protein n=1 Tax=Zalerion maritima TaxID=339359 RepID=A0AAD5WW75_9PEZI|nr:hypothetical protein MKZ38_005363 [Zalerion maritima]
MGQDGTTGAEDAVYSSLGPLMGVVGDKRARLFVEMAREQTAKTPDWFASLLPHVKLVSSTPSLTSELETHPHPSILFQYVVQPSHCNRLGNLHGGSTATLFDWCTTIPLALISKPGFWLFMGVTRTLNVTYLRPVPAGTQVDIHCEILQVGKRLCTVKGVMKRSDDGTIVAVCEHGKFNTDPSVKV